MGKRRYLPLQINSTVIQAKEPKNYKSRYLGLIALSLLLVVGTRIYETMMLYFLFNPSQLWRSESLGLLQDLLLCLGIFTLLSPIYKKIYPKRKQNLVYIFETMVVILTIAHIGILEYFFYQMEPLDVFIFGNTPDENVFSVKTSNLSFTRLYFCLAATVLILLVGLYYYRKFHLNSKYYNEIRIFGIIGLVFYIYIDNFGRFPVAIDLIKNKSKSFYANTLKFKTHQLIDTDLDEWSNKFQQNFPDKNYIDPKYPFLHKFEQENNLGEYLNKFDRSPNVVLLLTESLSEYFIHPIRGIQFMPFLDSLRKVSLYWPNHLSLGERSFAANPAITAGVPYGDAGFSIMNVYPYHFSLVNVLKKNKYYTSFYYVQGAWFHNKNHYYQFNNIDRIIDKNSFDPEFEKVIVGDENTFWGYNDIDLFKQYVKATDSLTNQKRLDILFTGTSHAPFIVKDPEYYNKRFQNDLEKITNKEDLEHFNSYKRFYLSLYNVDDAYRNLFETLKKRSDFDQTLFFLTGDHEMTELPRDNKLKPYKVPLFIYSPKLKHPYQFEEVCSHNDWYETILSYLGKEYRIKTPSLSTSLGRSIKFDKNFNTKGTYVFMNNNREIVDIFSDGYYYFADRYLFKVAPDFSIKEIVDPSLKAEMRNKLYAFQAASQKASKHDFLMPDSLYFQFMETPIYAYHNHKDSILNINSYYNIAEANIECLSEVYCDISFDPLSESLSIPKIQLDWVSNNNTILSHSALTYPLDKLNYQFHQVLKSPDLDCSKIILKIYFNPIAGQNFSIKNLKVCVYQKN